MAGNRFSWGTMVWLASGDLGATTLSVARMVLNPRTSSECHFHTNCDEVLFILRGSVKLTLHTRDGTNRDDFEPGAVADELELETGQSFLLRVGTPHRVHNTADEPAELLLSYGSADRDFHSCSACL